MKTENIVINNETFIAHPFGGLYWEAKKMLLIADVHFGKVTHFRKHGSAVPQAAIYENFEKLNSVINHFNPEHICFLGDLFHSYLNNEWKLFEEWNAAQSAKVILIVGNHDIISPDKYTRIGIQIASSLTIGNFYLTHHPEEQQKLFNFCGHVHPAVEVFGLGRQCIKVPCFYFQKSQMILPSFGTFTGNYVVTPKTGEKVFGITSDEVVEIQTVCEE